MKIPTAAFGYTLGGVTLAVAVLTPFLLIGLFANGFASLGLHVDEVYSGGPIVRTVNAQGYTVAIHRTVVPHLLQRGETFVQLDWKPVGALPPHMNELVDIDGDGQPDVRVSFDVPKNPKEHLHADIDALNARYRTVHGIGRDAFTSMIVRADDAILVRVPLAKGAR